MGLVQIKKDLTNTANICNTFSNDCSTLIKSVEQSTELTINNVYYPCSKLNSTGVQLENILKRTYKDIESGLEILLKQLANEINELETGVKSARKDSKKIKDNAKILYELALFDMSIEGFLEYDFSINKDIKPYLESIKQVQEQSKKIMQSCIYWNTQLIIKRRWDNAS